MDLVKLLTDLVAQINALQTALTDAQKAADELAVLKFQEGVASVVINPDLKFTQADLDKAFQDGVNSVGGTFTQADLDAAVANAVAPLNAQVMDLQSQVDAFPSKLSDAVSAAKVEMLDKVKAAYDSAQASESETEAAFKASLSSL